ncbi:MAG: hypothetical protein ACHQT5_01580 [Candidatus Saccharimonadales bacterium]|jgi:hypothetical protein
MYIMTAETALIEYDAPNEAELTETELNRVGTLIVGVIDDVRAGVEYPGFTVSYDETAHTATWMNTHNTLEARATAQDGVNTFSIAQKLTDEAGYNTTTTTVTVAGSEARMTKSKIRNTGLAFKEPTTKQLDRTTYDATLENLVAIKCTGNQESEPQESRRIRFGWLRSLVSR